MARDTCDRDTDLVEPLSLGEAYLDVTTNKVDIEIGHSDRPCHQAIQTETHLTASAGVSINKFLAKIASTLNKPDGLSRIPPEQAAAFVESLAIEKFYGVGAAAATKMKALGIHTGANLKQWSAADWVTQLGKVGQFYYQVARVARCSGRISE